MLAKSYPYYLGGEAVAANQDLAVHDKYTGEVATRVACADAATLERAIALAVAATGPMARLAAYERQAVCSTAWRASRRAPRNWRMSALHRGRQADQGRARRGQRA